MERYAWLLGWRARNSKLYAVRPRLCALHAWPVAVMR